MIQPSPERLNSSRSLRFSASRRSPVIEPSPDVAEAEDVRLRLVESLEVGAPADRRVERARRRAEVVVERAEPLGAVALERDPDLQDVHPPRALEAPRPLVPRPGALAGVEEVGRALGERGVEVPLVPHEDHPRRERHEHHLVRVPGDRAGPLEAAQPPAVRRREEGRRAVGAVDVQPEAALLAEPPDRLEVVEGAGRRRARRRDDGHDGAAPAPPAGRASAASAATSILYSREGTLTALSVPSPIAPTARATA